MSTPDEVPFVRAFASYLAKNHSPDGSQATYGIQIGRTFPELTVQLIFRSGITYCCCEPGCHMGLSFKGWQNLRRCFAAEGITPPAQIRLILHGIVQEGALFTHGQKSAMPSTAFEYREHYEEPLQT